ncbi:MAG: hypothetical protein ACKV0T_16360 [Planctomycetales bacterium]
MAKADIGQLMSSVGPALFEPVWNVLQVLPEDSPYAFLVNLKNVKYVVKDMDGDRATVSFQIQRDSPRDVEFVRVEGKWIPSALAEVWATYFFTLKTAFLQQPWDIEQRRTVIKNGARLDDSLTEMIETAKSGEVFSLGDFANDMISFLIGDVQPDFDRLTQLSIVRSRGPIVILCKIPAEGEISNDYIEGQMQQAIADQFSTNGVKVVDAGQVEKWVERDLGVVDCQALGNEFMAEYVIQVELGEYSVFEPNHSDLYRGYADVAVRVYRIDENTADAHVVYEKDFDFQFPGDRPLSYRDVSHAEFRRRFHAELGAKIGRLFCAKKHSSAKSGESR